MLKISLAFAFALEAIAFSTAQARLLTDGEMSQFIEAHQGELSLIQTRSSSHMAYCVVELANRRLNNNNFDVADKLDAATYYGRVIFSALNGIGFGGLSKTKSASADEQQAAYLALYSISVNLPTAFAFPLGDASSTPQAHRAHFETINHVLALGHKAGNGDTMAANTLAGLLGHKAAQVGGSEPITTTYRPGDLIPGGPAYTQARLSDSFLIIEIDEEGPETGLTTAQYMAKVRRYPDFEDMAKLSREAVEAMLANQLKKEREDRVELKTYMEETVAQFSAKMKKGEEWIAEMTAKVAENDARWTRERAEKDASWARECAERESRYMAEMKAQYEIHRSERDAFNAQIDEAIARLESMSDKERAEVAQRIAQEHPEVMLWMESYSESKELSLRESAGNYVKGF